MRIKLQFMNQSHRVAFIVLQIEHLGKQIVFDFTFDVPQ